MRYSSRFKCLLCYLICFSLPLLWQAAGIWVVYPYKLAGTAPDVAANLCAALPFAATNLAGAASRAAFSPNPDAAQLLAATAVREQHWFAFVGACAFAAWLLTLGIQLLWRFTHLNPGTERATRRAICAYRLTLPVICAVNLVFAGAVWLFGVRAVFGCTAWDYLAYFGAYALNALAALCAFRLAAPAALSGRHAFFKRL